MLALTCLLTFSSDFRLLITHDLLKMDNRKILSVITVENDNNDFKVLKIRRGKNLFIEIYSDNKREFFDLGLTTNGTVFLGGKSTELASVDLDNDGLREIIVPTLNDKFKSELYIIKYNLKAQTHSMSNSVPYLNLNP